jgi:hypothetical protein
MGKGRIGRRRRRVRCALRCQVLGPSRRPIEGRVVQLSEGGLSVVGPLQVEHGDPIRIRLLHHRKTAAIEVAAIVWNDEPARSALEEEGFRTVGCLVSDPPRAFLELFSQIARRNAPPIERRIPVVPARPSGAPGFEQDLPRSREIGPPPKPEENLPTFRIRVKQVGGPRTRSLAVRARSVAEAEAIARSELDSLVQSGPTWELIEVVLAG